MDDSGAEYPDGWVLVRDGLVEAVGGGRAARGGLGRRPRRRGRHARARQHAPPPVPDAHARPGAGRDALRVARRALPGLGAGSTPSPSTRPRGPGSPSSRCQVAQRCSTTTTSSRAGGPGSGRRRCRRPGARRPDRRLARLDGPRRVARRPPARLAGRADRRHPRRHRAARRAPGRGRDGAARRRALLAVLGDEGADGGVGRARAAARAEAAHASRRDGRGGRLLPRAIRLPAGRVPRGARLARGRRLVRALRPSLRARTSRAFGARRRRRRALPDVEPAARRRGRAGAGARRRGRAGRARRRRVGVERALRPLPRGEAGAARRARARRPARR